MMDTRALSISPMLIRLKRSTLKITPAPLCGPTPPVRAEQHVPVLPYPSSTLVLVPVLAVALPMPGHRWLKSRWCCW